MSSPEPKGKVAAFFDLDRTLLKVNSASLYIKHEQKHGRITKKQMFVSVFYMLLYHFSLVDLNAAYRRAARTYEGRDTQELMEMTERWFREEVEETLQPGGERALALHREAGHPCVLLTGSTSFMAEVVADCWGLDGWLASRFEVDEAGALTGQVEEPLCYGIGKVDWAERWADEHGVELSESYFYTDSFSDLPMLERVGNPRIVNPDPRLRRYAQRLGWPILDWSRGDAPALV